MSTVVEPLVPPYFNGVIYNSNQFTQTTGFITLNYANANYLKRVGAPISIATTTTFSGATQTTSSSTGTIVISGVGGLALTGGNVNIGGTTEASSSSVATLVCAGGVGIAKRLYVDGDVHFTSSTASVGQSSGALAITGGLGVVGAVNVNNFKSWSGTNSSSTITGAVQLLGGLGVVGEIYGGNVTATNITGNLVNSTGLPVSTGITGLGANVAAFLAVPTSINLGNAVTDETGTGALVFANTATFTGATLFGSFTVAGLPTASTNTGRVAQVTDQLVTPISGQTALGGGSIVTIVYSNGTSWLVMAGGGITTGTQTIAGAKTLSGITTFSSATPSTSISTGSAVVTGGGLGVLGNLFAGGNVSAGLNFQINGTQITTTALSDTTATTSWTPFDASGAGLSFTSVTGSYYKIGKLVYVTCQVTYPITSDGNTAAITNLPIAAAAIPNQVLTYASGTGFYRCGSITSAGNTITCTDSLNSTFSNGFLRISGTYLSA